MNDNELIIKIIENKNGAYESLQEYIFDLVIELLTKEKKFDYMDALEIAFDFSHEFMGLDIDENNLTNNDIKNLLFNVINC